MKLRNKKTGIIGELHFEPYKEYHFTVVTEDPVDVMIYKKLADLYADWEDYEEPKEYWHIFGTNITKTQECLDELYDKRNKEIGNYFETKEEAEKAVRKLKAYKRLKDKGFRFTGYNACSVDYDIDEEYRKYVSQDLNLLFGGEE